ncbi:ETC complex I subunit-like protein [Rhizobium azibense]|uniref:ETC complex I subunit-like protein n=1 Tax=Rhizobium azibense TaxID=1136135 RepID=A0A4R3RY72_9HYPH|nr:ETC complex I subunit-like protein [Rhizobium azibense]
METVRQIQGYRKDPTSQPRPLNDNNIRPLSMGRSIFPDEAVARIYSPSRSVTTSGKARKKCWRLAFERRAAPFIEPLMGYTGSRDTLTQVELSFATSHPPFATRTATAWPMSCGGRPTVTGGPKRAPNSRAERHTPSRMLPWSGSDSPDCRSVMGSRSTVQSAATTHRVPKAGLRRWMSFWILS